MKISASLNVTGRLHVKGDLVVLGSVVVDKGGELTVDRKRTVHGRVDGVIGNVERLKRVARVTRSYHALGHGLGCCDIWSTKHH